MHIDKLLFFFLYSVKRIVSNRWAISSFQPFLKAMSLIEDGWVAPNKHTLLVDLA